MIPQNHIISLNHMRKGARLGQHFLKSPWAARALARAVGATSYETVLEIGPGKGALTRELLSVSKKVVAVEKDEALVVHLKEIFRDEIDSGVLVIVAGDIRDIHQGETLKSPRSHLNGRKYVLAANIPYYITGEIIRQFLTAEEQPRAMALLVQKEVAQRIVAKKPAGGGSASGGKESLLSLSVKVYGTPKIIAKVSRGNFAPAPNVDSAILLIDNISRDFFKSVNEELFFKVIHAGFKSKRKYLLNNLATVFKKESVTDAFADCGIDMKARAEDIRLEAWKCLAIKLT